MLNALQRIIVPSANVLLVTVEIQREKVAYPVSLISFHDNHSIFHTNAKSIIDHNKIDIEDFAIFLYFR